MAAAASWMEATGLPLREVRRRYTKSELAIMGWRSGEIAANMHQNMVNARSQQSEMAQGVDKLVANAGKERELAVLEEKIGGFIWKAVDEKGEIDLRKLTGEEMRQYLDAMGFNVVPGMGR